MTQGNEFRSLIIFVSCLYCTCTQVIRLKIPISNLSRFQMPNPGPPAGAEVEHIQIRLLLHRSKAEPAPLVLHICFEILLEGLMHGRRVMGGHRPRAVGARIVPHGPHCKTLCERARVRARANKSETGQPCKTVTSSTHWNVGMRYCRHKTQITSTQQTRALTCRSSLSPS